FTVGGDDPLVDAPGRFDLNMLLDGEEGFEPCVLFLGEEAGTGVQGAAGTVERVTGTPAMPARVLLHALPAPVDRIPGETDRVKRIHDRNGVGQLFGGGGLEPAEAVHRDRLD